MIKLCSLILSLTYLASLVYSLAYLSLIYSITWLTLLFDSCEEFEAFTWTGFQNRIVFLVFVPISSIDTTFLYLYRSPISVPFFCIMIYDNDIYWAYLLACYHLPVITWLLHDVTWHLFDITYHLPLIPDCLTCDYHLYENSVLMSCIIYIDLNL